jgi:tetratricopeptide (TPR) repeat protein
MSQIANCPFCGSKIRADRDRCPKCRAWLIERDPAAASRRSRQLARWSAGLVAAFVVVVGGLWLTSDGEVPAAAATARPSDPLAARRRPRAEPAAPAAPKTPVERPFMDASAAAATSYSTGDYGSALEHYRAAVERNPQDAESLSNLGQVLVRLGKPEEALPYFERAIDLIPSRWAYRFNLARALGLLGRWDASIARYREAQKLFPDDHVTTFNLALALHKKGDDAAAVPEYQRAIALAPEDASFRFALALSYERLQKNAEAAAAYEEYLRLVPQAADADGVRARIAQLTAK